MQPNFSLNIEGTHLSVSLSGNWKNTKDTNTEVPVSRLVNDIYALSSKHSFDTVTILADGLDGCDSLLLSTLFSIRKELEQKKIIVDTHSLPNGLDAMIDMAFAVPSKEQKKSVDKGLFETIGEKIEHIPSIAIDVFHFLGEVTSSIFRMIIGKALFSKKDLWNVFRECGVDALPIVSLTSLLLGLILAFVSSMQLKLFGAEVYVASLVGVAMVRVMGPVLTGIVLAGRTGASFAAVIGSMQVNEEVDALTGFGIAATDFLVLPRILGMTIMTPLLTLYSDVAGILGGFIVGVFMLGISPESYIDNTLNFMRLQYIWIGLFHAFVFGFIISLCGCYQGIKSGKNASAVGMATTSAVVYSIVGIIVSTSIITIILTFVDL